MKKICFISSTRADFGILKNLILELKKNPSFNTKLIAGGSHYLSSYGNTYKEILGNNIKIDYSIKNKFNNDDEFAISKVFSKSLLETSQIIKKIKPDLIVVLGDRFEILASVISANFFRIPVAHLYGGEITYGALDDSYRHAITKLSHLHFVANDKYKKRVKQLGENPKNIFVVGGLTADNIIKTNFLKKSSLEKNLNIKFKKYNFIVNYHPETLKKNSSLKNINILIEAISKFKNMNFFFTSPGIDLESKLITKEIKKRLNKNIYFFRSLGQRRYFSLMRICTGIIGNSSSGILEMPYFNKITLNLGERQKGRIYAKSIINSPLRLNNITNFLKKIEKNSLKFNNTKLPYGKRGAIKKIISILKKIKKKDIFYKKFRDL